MNGLINKEKRPFYKTAALLLVAALVLPAAGCYRTHIIAKKGDVLMSYPTEGRVVDRIRVEDDHSFFLGGLIGRAEYDVGEMLDRALTERNIESRKVANLMVETYWSVGDALLGLITFFIYTPKSISIEGDVIE